MARLEGGVINPSFSEPNVFTVPQVDDKSGKENLQKISFRLNVGYLKSLMGILTLAEMLLGLILCCIVNAPGCSALSNSCVPPLSTSNTQLSGIGFILFVGIICIIGNFIFVVLHLTRSEFNRTLTISEFGYCVAACVFYFIATCVQTWYSTLLQTTEYAMELNPYRTQWIVAAIFCWLLFPSYLFQCVWYFPFRGSNTVV